MALPEGLPRFPRFVAAVCRFTLSAVARVSVVGLEHVPPRGALIVIANHGSNVDPPLVGGWLLPALGRPMLFLAKEQLFRGPVGAFLRSQNVYPVRAGGRDIEAYRHARSVLARDGVVCIFPEGTRSRDGRLGEPRPGVALLAARSGVPVLPVGIIGAARFLPPGARWPRIGSRLVVRVGPPFTIELDRSVPSRERTRAANDRLMAHLAALLPAEQRGRHDRFHAPPTPLTDE